MGDEAHTFRKHEFAPSEFPLYELRADEHGPAIHLGLDQAGHRPPIQVFKESCIVIFSRLEGLQSLEKSLNLGLDLTNDLRALRRLIRLSLAVGELFGLLFLLVVFVRPAAILGLLTTHADVVDLSLRYAFWLIPVLVLGSLAYIYDGLFLGLTEGRTLRNSMLVSTLVVFLPAALLALRLGDNHLLWAAMVLFMAARTATLGLIYPGLLRNYAEQ